MQISSRNFKFGVLALSLIVIGIPGAELLKDSTLSEAQVVFSTAKLLENPTLCNDIPYLTSFLDEELSRERCRSEVDAKTPSTTVEVDRFIRDLGLEGHFRSFKQLRDQYFTTARVRVSQYLSCLTAKGWLHSHLEEHFGISAAKSWSLRLAQSCRIKEFEKLGAPGKPWFLDDDGEITWNTVELALLEGGPPRFFYPKIDHRLNCEKLRFGSRANHCRFRAALLRDLKHSGRQSFCRSISETRTQRMCYSVAAEIDDLPYEMSKSGMLLTPRTAITRGFGRIPWMAFDHHELIFDELIASRIEPRDFTVLKADSPAIQRILEAVDHPLAGNPLNPLTLLKPDGIGKPIDLILQKPMIENKVRTYVGTSLTENDVKARLVVQENGLLTLEVRGLRGDRSTWSFRYEPSPLGEPYYIAYWTSRSN